MPGGIRITMYYTIEGKRFLCILYVAGLLAGSLFMNGAIKAGWFRAADFLAFTEYITAWKDMDNATFFSYVCLIRIRQLLVFFLCLFLFSPYVVFCVLDVMVSLSMGLFMTVLVVRHGWAGMLKGAGVLMPHYLFYVAVAGIVYVYLFRRNSLSGFYWRQTGGISVKQGKLLDNKIVVAALCLVLFAAGCGTEAYMNPGLLKLFFH